MVVVQERIDVRENIVQGKVSERGYRAHAGVTIGGVWFHELVVDKSRIRTKASKLHYVGRVKVSAALELKKTRNQRHVWILKRKQ